MKRCFFLFFRLATRHGPAHIHNTEGITISIFVSSLVFHRSVQPTKDYLAVANGGHLKLGLLRLGWFVDKRLVNVWNNTTTSNRSLDKCVKFLISTNGKLQVTWCDTLHLEILTCVTGQFENLGREVLQDSWCVNGRGCTDTLALLDGSLQETMDPTNGELWLR